MIYEKNLDFKEKYKITALHCKNDQNLLVGLQNGVIVYYDF